MARRKRQPFNPAKVHGRRSTDLLSNGKLTFYGMPNSVKLAKAVYGDSIDYVVVGLLDAKETGAQD